jgi:hypothetical protein
MTAPAAHAADVTRPSSGWRGWFLVALAYVATTLVHFWPLLPTLGSSLPADLGDPALNTWILWWNSQAVPFTERWWSPPIFFPEGDMLALSETLLGLTPVTTPLQWLGASPVLAYNLVLLLSYPTAALAAHALTFRLTRRHDAAFIAGMAFGFGPYRAGQLSHIQMMVTFWLPLGLLALHIFTDRGRWRWAVLAGLCWAGAGLTTGYFLVYFPVLIACWMAWFARSVRAWVVPLTSFALAALLMAPLLLAYQQKQQSFGLSRGIGEIETFSADLTSVWAATRRGDLVASWWTLEPKAEGELYPGVIVLGLVLVAGAWVWRARAVPGRSVLRRALLAGAALAAAAAAASWWFGGWQFGPISVNRPHRPVNVAVWLTAIAILTDGRMFLFALGPFPKVMGERFMYQAPYAWLMQLPGGDALRVPARFGALFTLCLAVAASLAFARLRDRGRAASVAAAVLGALIAVEGYMPVLAVLPMRPPLETTGLPDAAVVLELPLNHHASDTKALLRATRHGRPLINGYSGYFPPHYSILSTALQDQIDPDVMRVLQYLGPLVVLVSRDEGVFEQYRDLMDAYPDARRLAQIPAGIVYLLPAVQAPADDPRAQPLTIAEALASSREANAPLAVDGDVTTRWETDGPQTVGEQFTLRFARPVHVSRIEMDLGQWHGDFPRRLRVEIAGDAAGPGQIVWEESLTGETMLGLLEDHRRTPLVIRLPADVPAGRDVRLVVTTGHIEMSWSIAEIRAFGWPAG